MGDLPETAELAAAEAWFDTISAREDHEPRRFADLPVEQRQAMADDMRAVVLAVADWLEALPEADPREEFEGADFGDAAAALRGDV